MMVASRDSEPIARCVIIELNYAILEVVPPKARRDRREWPGGIRLRVRAGLLRGARRAVNVTSRDFARRAGWSRQYQDRIERGETFGVETARSLFQVLLDAGVATADAAVHGQEFTRRRPSRTPRTKRDSV